jgi:hypothetical protein
MKKGKWYGWKESDNDEEKFSMDELSQPTMEIND